MAETRPRARAVSERVSDLIRDSLVEHLTLESAPEEWYRRLHVLSEGLTPLLTSPIELDLFRRVLESILDNIRVPNPRQMVQGVIKEAQASAGPLTHKNGAGPGLFLPDPEPWPEPVDGVALVLRLVGMIERFVVLPDAAPISLALWVLFSHAHDAFQISPLLSICSPEKRCAKTLVLQLLHGVVRKPLFASNISTAALFRTIEKYQPTLLADELDTYLDEKEELRGILNSGHSRRGAVVVRTVGDDHDPVTFRTFCPKVLSRIGTLPDTLADRSIVLNLRRCTPEEAAKLERVRLDRLAEFEPLRQQCWRWAQDHLDILRTADPEVPDSVLKNARAADNWRPLLAIADAIGGYVPQLAREAAVMLTVGAVEVERPTTILLQDIRDIFDAPDARDKFTSAEIVEKLTQREDRPWAEWKANKPLSMNQLASLLRPFGIRPKAIWIQGKTYSGYEAADFQDAFSRYCPTLVSLQDLQGSSSEGKNKVLSELQGEVPLGGPDLGDTRLNEGTLGGLGGQTPEDEVPARGDAWEPEADSTKVADDDPLSSHEDPAA